MPRTSIERNPMRSVTWSVSLATSTLYSLGFSGDQSVRSALKENSARPLESVWNVLLNPTSGIRMVIFCCSCGPLSCNQPLIWRVGPFSSWTK